MYKFYCILAFICIIASCAKRSHTALQLDGPGSSSRDSLIGKYNGTVHFHTAYLEWDGIKGTNVRKEYDSTYPGSIELQAIGKDSFSRIASFKKGSESFYFYSSTVSGYYGYFKADPNHGGENFNCYPSKDSIYYYSGSWTTANTGSSVAFRGTK